MEWPAVSLGIQKRYGGLKERSSQRGYSPPRPAIYPNTVNFSRAPEIISGLRRTKKPRPAGGAAAYLRSVINLLECGRDTGRAPCSATPLKPCHAWLDKETTSGRQAEAAIGLMARISVHTPELNPIDLACSGTKSGEGPLPGPTTFNVTFP